MSFSVNFHYGDRVVRECVFYYKGGHEHAVENINLDNWSFCLMVVTKSVVKVGIMGEHIEIPLAVVHFNHCHLW